MKCSFCHQTIKPGTGLIYAKNDGKILYFCSGKCQKNMIKLKRKTTKWIKKKKK
jgi:large subunit ribosomal protein L24e